MCGINGIYSSQLVNNFAKRIGKMNDSIKHRGPDAEGSINLNNKISLGHRRLSIIDLDSRSNQPMLSNSGNTVLVYNGEIYNFQSIKNKLKYDYDFKTDSDTEIILAAYELKGINWLLEKINGMFAFAIYDIKQNSLFLARDRFGIKPLHYTVKNGLLIFSSEIKGILNSGLLQPEFNEKAVDEYLGYRYVREPYTFFKNIHQVKSSYCMQFKNGEFINEFKYWDLPSLNFSKNYSSKKIIEQTGYEVESAIKRWLIADVKVGAYLSGGVDSSLTTAILCKENKNNVNTYTIGFDEEGFNEFKYSKIVADLYQTKHHEIRLKQSDYFDEWVNLIEFKDAPLAVPNEIPLAIMSTELSKDITVVISGEGADELFGGYGRIFRSAFDFENESKQERSFYSYLVNKYEYVSRELRDKFLVTDENYRNEHDAELIESFKNHRNEENIFRFFHQQHIKSLLNRVDVTTMQTSVEARPPFLDHELIEFVYQDVPYDLKLKWNNNDSMNKAKAMSAIEYSEELDVPKYILKKVSEKYLPDENESLIIKSLVTEAPLQKIEGVNTVSLEKMLVDVFCDDVIFAAQQGSEMRNIFHEAKRKYVINENRLFRYANRRNKKDSFKEYYNSIRT